MATVVAGMTTSLDGFVKDSGGSASRLYPDLAALQGTAYMSSDIEKTGAVVMGRRTFEMGDPDSFVGTYEFQVPIYSCCSINHRRLFRSRTNASPLRS